MLRIFEGSCYVAWPTGGDRGCEVLLLTLSDLALCLGADACRLGTPRNSSR